MNDCFDDILDILNNHCEGGLWSLRREYHDSNLYGKFCYEVALDEKDLPTFKICYTYCYTYVRALSEYQVIDLANEIMTFAAVRIGRILIGNEYND